MAEKVVILTAGAGSRLNERTKWFNKALLRVGNQAAISHIIDLFPKDTEFVIALGYLSDIVCQYLMHAHPPWEYNLKYVGVDQYSVPGSGPGYALNQCRKYLQQPFYICACDTLIDHASFHAYGYSDTNFVAEGAIPEDRISKYCTLQVDDEKQVTKFFDKDPNGTTKAFTGLAYVKDWQEFWQAMDDNTELINDEIQISPALAKLPKVISLPMRWHDIGHEEGLLEARAAYPGIKNLDKFNEELYVVRHNVIKYFADHEIVDSRIRRTAFLNGLVPPIIGHTKNFYRYNFVYGQDLFERADLPELMTKLLDFCEEKLWIPPSAPYDGEVFRYACEVFYKKKTLDRLSYFYSTKKVNDRPEIINDCKTQSMHHYIYEIDWERLCDGAVISCFHGDFQPGNILIDFEGHFKFIDWRQDFGGLIDYGDKYYDFAKLYACLLMPHPSIKAKAYKIDRSDHEKVVATIEIPDHIRESKCIFEEWLKKHNYNLKHTQLLAAIVLLNMAALHEHPLDLWLYYYGKSLLGQVFGSTDAA